MSDSAAVDKQQCPECAKKGGDNSGDNLVIYDDGHGHCFACGYRTGTAAPATTSSPKRGGKKDLLDIGEYRALLKRGISEETCKFFGYSVGSCKGKTVQIANYKHDGTVVAQKVRFANKDFLFLGDAKSAGLFGQHLWRDGGKRLVITEGEIDALTISQLQSNKWPVVSLPTGAGGAEKAIREQIEWVEKFESVVFAFDMDDPGREAAKECAALLTPGRAYIANLPAKDANEALLGGLSKQLIQSLWDAKPFRPDGLVSIDDLMDEVEKPTENGLPWCIEQLTKLTYGRRLGEIYAIGAGTGIGKTDFMTQQAAYDVTVLNQKVGVIYLEQKPTETAKRVAGKVAKQRFHIPDAGWTIEQQRTALASLKGSVMFYDSFGETEWEVVQAKIRYMAVSLGIKLFYLDHLTAMADTANEKGSIEQIMKEMAGLANELGLIIHFVSHLATPEGKPHEEGGRVMAKHFKGSRAIAFWSYFMFGLERDTQADTEEGKITTFRCLKDRYTGRANGKTFGLGYDDDTGLLFECAIPKKSDSPFEKQGETQTEVEY